MTIDLDYSFANSAELAATAGKHKGFINPVLIGDVVYLSPVKNSAVHQSRFIYDIFETRDSGAFAIEVSNGDMRAAQLTISKWIEAGSFSAD